MNITVFGSGYVGLVTGVCLAEVGNNVLCIDTDVQKINSLNNGIVPIYEPGLDLLIKKNMTAGRLNFTTDAEKAVKHGTYQFIAVGTPPDEDGAADLKYVVEVARTIATYMDGYQVVIDKSTVPVGTADKVKQAITEILNERGENHQFDVVSNPEFLKEGAAIDDFMKPDRIVIGTDSTKSTELLRTLYAPFNRNHDRMICVDIRSAELIKYAANAMLATKISFMNELANLAELLGADIEAVRQGIGADSRIGYSFIYPGCGYGGSCFPKDVSALIKTANEVGYSTPLLDAVETVNNRQKNRLFEKIYAHFNGNLENRTFAVWGLAFKPNTDDMRQAPSIDLLTSLWQAGAKVQAFDPIAHDEAKRIFGDNKQLILADTPDQATVKADALVLVTEWRIFQSPDFGLLANNMAQKIIFDGRNIYDPQAAKENGFTYYGIGR